jgi:hypothetical protein
MKRRSLNTCSGKDARIQVKRSLSFEVPRL